MLIIRRSILITVFTLFITAVIGIGAWSYLVINGSSAASAASDNMFQAENVLFTSIVIATLLTTVSLFIIIRSKNMDRMLDKLIKQRELNPSSTAKGLLKLGITGGKLNTLYHGLDEISEKRSLKISALSAALSFFIARNPEPAALINLKGEVIQRSNGWLQLFNSVYNQNGNEEIKLITDGKNVSDIVMEYEKTHLPVEIDYNGTKFSYITITDKKKSPVYLAVVTRTA